jgi:hypothetical protein
VPLFAAERASILGNDPDQARAPAMRLWDRTPSAHATVHQANQVGTVFAHLDCAPRWRERLGDLRLTHADRARPNDPFFPVGNGKAFVAEAPSPRHA